MKQFTYTIKDPLGMHARPGGLLAKEAKRFTSVTTVTKGENSAKAHLLMQMMRLGIKKGDVITVSVEGEDEAEAAEAIQAFLEKNL